MILICPVRPGDSNEELRYAIRSWEANLHLPDGLDLITVGYKPTWLDPDQHMEGNLYPSVMHAVWDNVYRASQYLALRGSAEKEVAFMNDDFFCLDPVGSILPVKRDVTLAEHIAKSPNPMTHWWARSLDLTASWLSEVGFPHPDSYEVHRPLLATPGGMFQALSTWDRGMEDTIPQWRTVYGVLNSIEAYPVKDCKLGTRTTGVGSAWISTSDTSWRRYGREISGRFQKPSRWEI